MSVQGIVFDHSKERLHEALGIVNERASELSVVLVRVWVESDTLSEMIEKILSDDGLSDAEKVYMLVKLGHIIALRQIILG